MRAPLRFAAAFLFVLPACGPPPPAASPPAEHAGHEAHEGGEMHAGHHEHAEMAGPVKDLHDVLAPVWHMPKGPERAAKACTQALTFHDKSMAIQRAAVPDHKAAANELVDASKQLVAECEKEGRPELEARFAAFHERFHKLLEHPEH